MSIPGQLKEAFEERELTLYLGAGVSIPSGLPSWDRLVQMMYLAALGELDHANNPLRDLRVFPNYLEAIAEWLRRSIQDPAEITAQKILQMIRTEQGSGSQDKQNDEKFIDLLRATLYSPLQDSGFRHNRTLDAVRDLCRAGGDGRGVRCIVTYNYDDLVECSDQMFDPVWTPHAKPQHGKVPVFHVHGYLPRDGQGSTYNELILTEEQFHAAASDPYAWSNLVQMRQLGSNVGLMIGMSMTDRNLRRILEAMGKLPDLCPQYVILRRDPIKLRRRDFEEIEDMAAEYGAFRKSPSRSRQQIQHIFDKLQELDVKTTEQVLDRLGVDVIWVDEYDEIPLHLQEIAAPS